jgi:AcrR family transcriptional regulator
MTDGPDRRTRILDVATTLFEQNGFASVGVDRIAAALGVGAMTLYRNVGNKDELITTVLERWSAQWQQWVNEEVTSRPRSGPERLLGLFDVLEEWFLAPEYHGSLVENAAVELRGRPDHPAHQVIAEHRAWLLQFLGRLAADAGAEDPPVVATHLYVVVLGAITRARAGEGASAAASGRTLTTRLLQSPPPS